MRFWWRNDNKNLDGKPGTPTKGRAYLEWSDRETWTWEWKVPSFAARATLEVSSYSERALVVGLALPPVELFFGWDSSWLADVLDAWLDEGRGRELSIAVFDWALWWRFWTNPSEWHAGIPRWRHGSWHPFHFPGSRKGTPKVMEERDVDVPFPSRVYRAHATRSVMSVRHPRFPWWTTQISSVELDFDPFGAYPSSRKDSTHSVSAPARSIDEAIGHFVGSELRYNARRDTGDFEEG